MKRFYYKIENTTKNPSIYGGRKQIAKVYKIGRNGLEYLGKTEEWNTSSYRGSDSEVNEWLIENKIIPKSWSKGYDFQTCTSYRGSYYTPYYNINDKYSIDEIY